MIFKFVSDIRSSVRAKLLEFLEADTHLCLVYLQKRVFPGLTETSRHSGLSMKQESALRQSIVYPVLNFSQRKNTTSIYQSVGKQ